MNQIKIENNYNLSDIFINFSSFIEQLIIVDENLITFEKQKNDSRSINTYCIIIEKLYNLDIDIETLSLYIYLLSRNDIVNTDLLDYQRKVELLFLRLDNIKSTIVVDTNMCRIDEANLSKELYTYYQKIIENNLNEKLLENQHDNEFLQEIIFNTELLYQNLSNKNKFFISDIIFDQVISRRKHFFKKALYLLKYSKLDSYQQLFSLNYLNLISAYTRFAIVNNFESVLSLQLSDYQISDNFYYKIIDIIKNNCDLLHSYFDFKCLCLQKVKLGFYDCFSVSLYRPFKKFQYNNSINLICNSLLIFGTEYQTLLLEILNSNRILLTPSRRRVLGAFHISGYSVPSYISLQFNNSFESVLELIHELGHAISFSFAKQSQGFSSYKQFELLEEVPSLLHEILFIRYMIQNSTKTSEKKYYINIFLEFLRGNLFQQVLYSDFEHQLYSSYLEEGSLEISQINELFAELVKAYYGEKVFVDEYVHIHWVRVSHFTDPYSVINYPLAMLIAFYLIEKIDKNQFVITDYFSFLKYGSSKSIEEQLSIIDFNIEDELLINSIFTYIKSIFTNYLDILKKN